MGATISDANLRVFFYGGWGGMAPGGCFVGRTTGPWAEGTVTWNTNPGFTDSHVIAESPQYYFWWNIDITDYAAGWVGGSYENYGVELGCTSATYNGIFFYTKEFSNPGFWPELELDYGPTGVESASLGNIKAAFR